LQAGRHGTVVFVALRGVRRALIGLSRRLLLLVGTLLLRLALHLIMAAEAANHCAGRRTDGGALAGIATDRAADGADGRATSAATQETALPGFLLGRRRWRWCWSGARARRIESSLRNGPAMALVAIAVLLLLTLPSPRYMKTSCAPAAGAMTLNNIIKIATWPDKPTASA
jgi:hypothetical protein